MSTEQATQTKWKGFLKDVLILTVPPFVFGYVAILFGVVAVLAKETVMKSLIEAEATILGFYGLIVVYVLKSLDDKEDRYVQMYFDLQMRNRQNEPTLVQARELGVENVDKPDITIWIKDAKGSFLHGFIEQTNKQKKAIVRFTRTIGAYLFSSILLSIWILGMPDLVVAGLLAIIAVYLFIVGVVSIFLMFGDIGKIRLRIT